MSMTKVAASRLNVGAVHELASRSPKLAARSESKQHLGLLDLEPHSMCQAWIPAFLSRIPSKYFFRGPSDIPASTSTYMTATYSTSRAIIPKFDSRSLAQCLMVTGISALTLLYHVRGSSLISMAVPKSARGVVLPEGAGPGRLVDRRLCYFNFCDVQKRLFWDPCISAAGTGRGFEFSGSDRGSSRDDKRFKFLLPKLSDQLRPRYPRKTPPGLNRYGSAGVVVRVRAETNRWAW